MSSDTASEDVYVAVPVPDSEQSATTVMPYTSSTTVAESSANIAGDSAMKNGASGLVAEGWAAQIDPNESHESTISFGITDMYPHMPVYDRKLSTRLPRSSGIYYTYLSSISVMILARLYPITKY